MPALWSAEPWETHRTPLSKNPFSFVQPFEASFVFGWSHLFKAGRAQAKLEVDDAQNYRVRVQGGSTGVARALWKLDADYKAQGSTTSLLPFRFRQVEKYAKREMVTEAIFSSSDVWRLRQATPGKKEKWKHIVYPDLRDLVAAMFFIRSQPLHVNDRISVVCYPGDRIFFVEADVQKRETIRVGDREWNAIKLGLRIQRVVQSGQEKGKLEPHSKFREGSVWISDDAHRIPLRTEVQIFIGYVYGELEAWRFSE